LKSTETDETIKPVFVQIHFSNFGSLKSTETSAPRAPQRARLRYFSNFGSLKSTETVKTLTETALSVLFQQFRLVEEH